MKHGSVSSTVHGGEKRSSVILGPSRLVFQGKEALTEVTSTFIVPVYRVERDGTELSPVGDLKRLLGRADGRGLLAVRPSAIWLSSI